MKPVNLIHNKPHTEETKKYLSKIATENPSRGRLGKKCSEEQKEKIRQKLSGDKSNLWIDGRSKMLGYESFRCFRRYIRKKGNGGSHALEEWNKLKERLNYTCQICGLKEPEIKLTEDHIISLKLGGSDDIENIQPLCKSCNSKKGWK